MSSLWIESYHQTVCAIYPSSHLAHLDVLHCMDMLDILEQNAYAEEAIWNQKSLILS